MKRRVFRLTKIQRGMDIKTRGDLNPDRKPKVYFTAYSNDVAQYVDIVSEMIQNAQNCAVYYDKDVKNIDVENIKLMQLVVIAITGNFVHKESEAYNVVFKCAVENHIPVLPIIVEQLNSTELTKLNDMLGNIQCLDYCSKDVTALSFDSKLSKYLKEVLIGDELAEKLKSAFDAYIFLSYRKMDRAYANKLIRLIHSNDFARDVAVWFDEFLVPGEKFDASIERALRSSDLFMISVTPNILNNPGEKPNYVQDIEYPLASDINKKILPVEMVKTSRSELQEQYRGIPECVGIEDEERFSQELLKSLGNVIKTNEDDPKHNFFIGLAYLGGIDVEKNSELALKLISAAADAGLAEAMEKLAMMYKTGDGVGYDIDLAIEWQKKFADNIGGVYKQSKEESDGLAWIDSLIALGEMYLTVFNVKHINDACDIMKFTLDNAKEINFLFDSNGTKERLVRSYMIYGDVSEACQYKNDALTCYENAINVCREIVIHKLIDAGTEGIYFWGCNDNKMLIETIFKNGIDITPAAENFGCLIELIYRWTGIHTGFGGEKQLDEAFNEIDWAVVGARILIKYDSDGGWEGHLYKGLMYLGDVYFRDKSYGKARPCFGEAMKGYTKLYAERRDINSELGIFDSTIKLAQAYGEDGLLNKGAVYYENALDLAEKLAKEQSGILPKIDLAYCLSVFAEWEKKYAELLALDPNVLAQNYNRVMNYMNDALKYFDRAFDIINELQESGVAIFTNPDYKKAAMVYKNYRRCAELLGYIYEQCGEYRDAADWYIRCCGCMKFFEDMLPDESQRLAIISRLRDLGYKCEKANDRKLAEMCYHADLKCTSESVDKYNSFFSYEAYFCVCEDLARLYWNDGDKSIMYIEEMIYTLNIIIERFTDDPKYLKMKEDAEGRLRYKKFMQLLEGNN